ncbi:toll/interleukin-1 receptor domain-containing protein [Pseudonocardia alaniniphila]|uniref:Toll/interleukin-1 receptor domain-containing protein n=2 Tax=Pseudonocardia alaniniphila TaxID=75291 RepID=A0ABS9TFH3_9PSEU|nr:toll/interleukin-1 receptor domain-containing protein [Pseudonocardia alaniniphila]
MTGDRIEIFMDRDDIGWGQQWSQVINLGINKTIFMMPVVTPSYFQSSACRDELLEFSALCARRGLSDLILPVIFTGLERISVDSDDQVVRIIADAQFEDFTEIWPYARGGEQWMLGVRRVVTELVKAERRVDERLAELANEPIVEVPSDGDDFDVPDDEMGVAEYMAEIGPASEEAVHALEAAVAQFSEFSMALTGTPLGAGKFTASDPRLFQAQIATAAAAIKEPAQNLEAAGSNALDKVSAANALVMGVRQSVAGMHNREFEEAFISSLGNLQSVDDVVAQMEEMIRQMSDLERLSSVLRRELRPARRGMQFLRDAGRLVSAWAQ